MTPSYFVVGSEVSGKTTFLAEQLKGQKVLWLSMLTAAPVEFDQKEIVFEKDIKAVLDSPEFKSYTHVVWDTVSVMTDIILQNINEKNNMQVYGILAQKMLDYIQRFRQHGARISMTCGIRVDEAAKAEIALAAKVKALVLPLASNKVFVYTKRTPTGMDYKAQTDSAAALQLIP